MIKRQLFILLFITLASVVSACGAPRATEPPVTPPAISVQITKDYCPSIEVQAGMQIAWTNMDTVDRVLWIEHRDEQGTITDAGGTDPLQPGATFSISLTDTGKYTYYCSRDHQAFGTITVVP